MRLSKIAACFLPASTLFLSIGFATQRETTSTIIRLYAYTQFGGGDIIVHLASAAPGCTKGFWLSPNDDGFRTTYALLLSAYHTQTPVRIAGEDTQIWTGSGDVYCRMTFAGIDG